MTNTLHIKDPQGARASRSRTGAGAGDATGGAIYRAS